MTDIIKQTNKDDFYFSVAIKETLSAQTLFRLAEDNYAQGSPWSIGGFEQDLANPHAKYVTVLYKKEVIGYLGLHQILDEAEITNIVVDKPFQQQGIAAKLLQFGIEMLAAEQVERIFLEVRKSNPAAVHLYQKLRFTIIGERKQYYTNPREDAFIMQWHSKNEMSKPRKSEWN